MQNNNRTFEMKLPINGACLCRAATYIVDALPKKSGFCFYRSCQINSGSDHIAYLAFEKEAVHVNGQIKWYSAIGDSGQKKAHGFCSVCGSVLFGLPLIWPHIMVIYAGSLEDPKIFQPEVNLWLSEAQPWACIQRSLVCFDKNPVKNEK